MDELTQLRQQNAALRCMLEICERSLRACAASLDTEDVNLRAAASLLHIADKAQAALAEGLDDAVKTFPVMDSGDAPACVPFEWVLQYEAQAKRTHTQTIQRLAERGGLDPVELWGLAHGMNPWAGNCPGLSNARAWLKTCPWVVDAGV